MAVLYAELWLIPIGRKDNRFVPMFVGCVNGSSEHALVLGDGGEADGGVLKVLTYFYFYNK